MKVAKLVMSSATEDDVQPDTSISRGATSLLDPLQRLGADRVHRVPEPAVVQRASADPGEPVRGGAASTSPRTRAFEHGSTSRFSAANAR